MTTLRRAVRISWRNHRKDMAHIWVIGNELNIAGEWPYNPATTRLDYVSPSNYAACFRKVYNAIKAVRPNDKVSASARAVLRALRSTELAAVGNKLSRGRQSAQLGAAS